MLQVSSNMVIHFLIITHTHAPPLLLPSNSRQVPPLLPSDSRRAPPLLPSTAGGLLLSFHQWEDWSPCEQVPTSSPSLRQQKDGSLRRHRSLLLSPFPRTCYTIDEPLKVSHCMNINKPLLPSAARSCRSLELPSAQDVFHSYAGEMSYTYLRGHGQAV